MFAQPRVFPWVAAHNAFDILPAMSLARIAIWALRALWITAAVLVLYTITGFFILPMIVRAQLVKRLSAESDRPVTVGKVRMNPYAFTATIENLEVGERTGTGALFGWQRLNVSLEAFASMKGEWVLSEIALDGFYAHGVVSPEGRLNLSAWLARVCGTSSAPNIPSATKPSRAFLIRSLKVTGARIDFTDNSRGKPFRTVVDLVRFSLTAFRTAGDCAAPCHFEAVTESGEHLAWTGTLSVDPLCFRGDFSVENLDLPKYTPYIDQALSADIAAGKLTVRGHCEERFDPGKRVLSLTDGGLDLRDLRIVERGTGRQAIQLSVDAGGHRDRC